MKYSKYFIFDSNDNYIACYSTIKELDILLDAHSEEKLVYMVLPFDSVEELNKNGTIKSGKFISKPVPIMETMDYTLSESIDLTISGLFDTKQAILKSGVFISELNTSISCDQDSIDTISNLIQYMKLFNETSSSIYNIYNELIPVTLDTLEVTYKKIIQRNILVTTKYSEVLGKAYLVETKDELQAVVKELYL